MLTPYVARKASRAGQLSIALTTAACRPRDILPDNLDQHKPHVGDPRLHLRGEQPCWPARRRRTVASVVPSESRGGERRRVHRGDTDFPQLDPRSRHFRRRSSSSTRCKPHGTSTRIHSTRTQRATRRAHHLFFVHGSHFESYGLAHLTSTAFGFDAVAGGVHGEWIGHGDALRPADAVS